MESNLLGSGGRLYASVVNTDGEWSGFLYYTDHNLADGDRWSASGVHTREEVETW